MPSSTSTTCASSRDPFDGLTGPDRRRLVTEVRARIVADRMKRAARAVVARCALRGVA